MKIKTEPGNQVLEAIEAVENSIFELVIQ